MANLMINRGLKAFFSKNEGSSLIIVGVMLFTIVAILMVTVDLSRMQTGKTNNQSAIDAATLGAAEYLTRYRILNNTTTSPSDLTDQTKLILLQNLANDQADATLATKTDAEGNVVDDFDLVVEGDRVRVTACLNIKTGFASALNQGPIQKVCSTSEATVPGIRNAEIVFALDISASMDYEYPSPSGNVTKIQALKDSIYAVLSSYSNNDSIYWGIVPYTGHVNLGYSAADVVLDDWSSAEPASDLQPATVSVKGVNRTYQYKFNATEDSVLSTDFASPFNEQRFGPNGWGDDDPRYALQRLYWVPLTTRANGVTNLLDNTPPNPGNSNTMFQAYWHHPYDWWLDSDHISEGSNYYYPTMGNGPGPIGPDRCGECYTVHDDRPVRIDANKDKHCRYPGTNDCARPVTDPKYPGIDFCGGGGTEGSGN